MIEKAKGSGIGASIFPWLHQGHYGFVLADYVSGTIESGDSLDSGPPPCFIDAVYCFLLLAKPSVSWRAGSLTTLMNQRKSPRSNTMLVNLGYEKQKDGFSCGFYIMSAIRDICAPTSFPSVSNYERYSAGKAIGWRKLALQMYIQQLLSTRASEKVQDRETLSFLLIASLERSVAQNGVLAGVDASRLRNCHQMPTPDVVGMSDNEILSAPATDLSKESNTQHTRVNFCRIHYNGSIVNANILFGVAMRCGTLRQERTKHPRVVTFKDGGLTGDLTALSGIEARIPSRINFEKKSDRYEYTQCFRQLGWHIPASWLGRDRNDQHIRTGRNSDVCDPQRYKPSKNSEIVALPDQGEFEGLTESESEDSDGQSSSGSTPPATNIPSRPERYNLDIEKQLAEYTQATGYLWSRGRTKSMRARQPGTVAKKWWYFCQQRTRPTLQPNSTGRRKEMTGCQWEAVALRRRGGPGLAARDEFLYHGSHNHAAPLRMTSCKSSSETENTTAIAAGLDHGQEDLTPAPCQISAKPHPLIYSKNVDGFGLELENLVSTTADLLKAAVSDMRLRHGFLGTRCRGTDRNIRIRFDCSKPDCHFYCVFRPDGKAAPLWALVKLTAQHTCQPSTAEDSRDCRHLTSSMASEAHRLSTVSHLGTSKVMRALEDKFDVRLDQTFFRNYINRMQRNYRENSYHKLVRDLEIRCQDDNRLRYAFQTEDGDKGPISRVIFCLPDWLDNFHKYGIVAFAIDAKARATVYNMPLIGIAGRNHQGSLLLFGIGILETKPRSP